MVRLLASAALSLFLSLLFFDTVTAVPTISNSTRTLFERDHLSKRIVSGPVIKTNFPDPSILWVEADKLWYAYATNGNNKRVQTATSKDFVTWTLGPDALPNVPSWAASPANVWAPMVVQLDNGSFVMYYAVSSKSTGSHCIAVATSKTALGPYTPLELTFACHQDQGGAIDPAGFRHPDGTHWVVYKIDGNAKGHGGSCGNSVAPIQSTPIMLQQVAADGFTKIGSEKQILDRDDGDGPLIEAPSLITVGGVFFLFFSSGCYAETTYDLSYATADVVTGPYTKARAPNAPLLVTGKDGLKAPGSACFSTGGTKMAFHGWLGDGVSNGRGMWTGIPKFNGKTVSI